MFSPQDQMLTYAPRPLPVDRTTSWKPNVELAPNCPRCDSSITKFCYYNNYSLTQPRYFCKGCRRYWTKGGSLRNVPIGGGCRKNRRGKSVRLSSDPISAGDRSYYRSLPNSLRQHLALDDMVGNSHRFIGSGSTVQPMDMPTGSDCSNIDLAQLYTKFLNHCPMVDNTGMVAPDQFSGDRQFEAIDSVNSNHQIPLQLPNQAPSDGMSEFLMSNENQVPVGGLAFSTDSSSYESLEFSTDGVGDVLLPDCSIVPNLSWQAPEYQGFHSVPENSMIHHQDLMLGDWSTLDQLNFDVL